MPEMTSDRLKNSSAENQLSKIDFRVLFESVPGLYLVLAPTFEIVAVSDAYLKATLTKRDEILGRNLFEVFPDDPNTLDQGPQNLKASLERVLKTKSADSMAVQKYSLKRSDGTFEKRFWSPLNSAVLDSDNNIKFIIHRVEDVTEFMRLSHQKEKETKASELLKSETARMELETIERAREIQRANEQLRFANKEIEALKAGILETSLDAIISMDHTGRILEFNPAAEATFGHKRDEVIGKEMAEVIIPPRLREAHRKGLARYLQTGDGPVLGRRIEVPAIRKDGTEFPAQLAITRVKTSGAPLFTGFLRDITEEKSLERERIENQERQKFLAEATGILSSSLNYEKTLENLAQLAVKNICDWCAIYTWEEGQPRPTRFTSAGPDSEKYPLDPNSETGVLNVIRTGKSELYSEISEEMNSAMIVPIRSEGEPIGAITLISSSEGKRFTQSDLHFVEELASRASFAIENALLYQKAQNAVTELDRFATVAAHDLKAPLNSITQFSSLLSRQCRGKLDQDADEYIDFIIGAGKRMSNLIDSLLAYARTGQKIEKKPLELNQVISNLRKDLVALISESDARITTSKLPRVLGDESQLTQAFQNLVANAIKYRNKNMAPVVHIDSEEYSSGHYQISISDNGIGIPENQISRIFDVFRRGHSSRDVEGAGIGLATVKKIITNHGGKVWVESVVGKGSTFHLTLPKG